MYLSKTYITWLYTYSDKSSYIMSPYMSPRQAKEKSKGTWVEKPLCDLEGIYSSPEDRQWLKTAIVDSVRLRHICFKLLWSLDAFWIRLPWLRTSWSCAPSGPILTVASNWCNTFSFWFSQCMHGIGLRIQRIPAVDCTRCSCSLSTQASASILDVGYFELPQCVYIYKCLRCKNHPEVCKISNIYLQ